MVTVNLTLIQSIFVESGSNREHLHFHLIFILNAALWSYLPITWQCNLPINCLQTISFALSLALSLALAFRLSFSNFAFFYLCQSVVFPLTFDFISKLSFYKANDNAFMFTFSLFNGGMSSIVSSYNIKNCEESFRVVTVMLFHSTVSLAVPFSTCYLLYLLSIFRSI